MISLANFVYEHREAVERDLLIETGHELDDIGRSLSWGALRSFLSSVKLGSALGAELNPDMTEWATPARTNAILADIYDMLAVINAQLHVIASRKKGRKPERYKRPWDTEKNKHHFGKGVLSLSEMREWLKSRQRG